jgi:hypothetical protein
MIKNPQGAKIECINPLGRRDQEMQISHWKRRCRTRIQSRGTALIEVSLMLPWFLFLFMATFDLGFYCYALAAVENGTRAAVLRTSANSASSSDQTAACTLALNQLRGLPNVGQSFASSCNSDPITVTAGYCDSTTACSVGAGSPDGEPAAFVSVTYKMPAMFRFPVHGFSSVTRVAWMRLRDNTQ